MFRARFYSAVAVLLSHSFGFSAYAQAAAESHPTNADAYARFALANVGNVERGRAVFTNPQVPGCVRCHTTDAGGSRTGPDLFAIADKFSRADIIRSILEPSAAIDVGYDTTVIETKNGEEFSGVVKRASDASVDLMSWDGKVFHIATTDIRSRNTATNSFMPEGLQNGMSPQNFDDLVEYLETLHQPTNLDNGGMPQQIPRAAHGVGLQPFLGPDLRLEHPVWFDELPGFTDRFVVLEHGGKSWLIERTAGSNRKSTLVDLSHTVRFGGATGLLGIAFHPQFSQNRKYYLKYQVATNGIICTLLVERKFAADFSGDSGEPGREILRIRGATQDHNGGCIEFGPDGYLYLGMGDTSPQRDSEGHAQNLRMMLGKMLRLDVDHPSNERTYGIPSDNPFVNDTNVLPEIWAYGLREPWRFTFDPANGDLWVGDVGQDQYEEVSIVRAGENQGWNVFEGFTPFSDYYCRPNEKYIPPVFSYPHRMGVCVTGGYVYRGSNAPAMAGHYVFGDFQVQHLWALTQKDRKLTGIIQIGDAPTRFAAFGRDHTGELYLVGYDNGIIYKLDLSAIDPAPLETKILAPTSEHAPVMWHYALQAPATNWFQPDFDCANWNFGPGGSGTRGTPGAVVRTEWSTDDIWLRREFAIGDGATLARAKSIILRLHHDEDAKVYLNGVEAAHLPRWTTGYVETPVSPAAIGALHSGKNLIAIHCHQISGGQYIDAGLFETLLSSLAQNRSTR